MKTRSLPTRPPIEIVSTIKAEFADVMLCVIDDEDEPFFADDVHTECADCGRLIRHRPGAPKWPRKLCPACALALAEGINN